ncbi:CinA family protein [Merdibacter massiliensis]|uniref:CinA family protein n=1 Tax=Merdibacter massiliensis TaxID=1871030 RepID=UPI002E256624
MAIERYRDGNNVMKELVELLKEKKLTIASCESLTAGLFSSRIAEIPGASNVLVGAIVTYATRIKEEIVHVDPKIIEQEGVVSAACAKAMAENTRKLLQADLCVSFTGNAGPACMEEQPAGSVYCALASAKGCQSYHFQIDHADRNEVRERVVQAMRDQVILFLKKEQEIENG